MIDSASPEVGVLTPSCTDLVYIHMDLNTRVLWSESFQCHLIMNIRFSRYITPGYFFPGTAGLFTSSKSHSRPSAIILARHHIGIGPSVIIDLSRPRVHDSDSCIDAPDFYESSFWKDSDPVSGLGGWGDPNADFRVPDGGFHTLPLSYPSSHTVRRNFTLRAFSGPFPFPRDPLTIGNASFSASVIEEILQTSSGDYKGFQKGLEAFEVNNMSHRPGFLIAK